MEPDDRCHPESEWIPQGPEAVRREVLQIASLFLNSDDLSFFEGSLADARRLFSGQYPGYRASNTSYHDWDHTSAVVLAAVRLIHGCILNGSLFLSRQTLTAALAALFHDAGLIQEEGDRGGTGAKHTVGHEERSIRFLENYLPEHGFSSGEIEDCRRFIQCTVLSLPPPSIAFPSRPLRRLGYIVGSADLLAQMADRLYLEKLLLLWEEFEEARIPAYASALDLLQRTRDFYATVARKRLLDDFEGICGNMRFHFRQRHGLDKDCYMEAIERSIAYLSEVQSLCRDSFSCFLKYLKRGGIAASFLGADPATG